MPINPNIALGVQPIQQTNMLGQVGQMMALKAASQDIQGNEALRDFYTKGGDATTPEGIRALMAANPKMGMQILKGQSEMSARDVETQAKSLKSIKDNVSLVNSREGMVDFLKGAYSTPGGALLQKLVPLDKAIANIPTDPKAFEDYKRNLGLTSEKLFESADAQLRARTSITTTSMTNKQSDINSLRTDTREREKFTPLAGEETLPDGTKRPVYYGYSPFTNTAEKSTTPTVNVGPITTIDPNAPVNSLAPTQPNVNTLSAPQAGVPTSPVARPPVLTAPSAAAPNAAIPSATSPTSVSGGVRFGPKSTSDSLTEAQGKGTMFATRAKQAHEILNAIGQDGKVQPGLIKRSAEAVPFVGEGLGTVLNFTQSEAQQQVEQAQRNFINALLRQESGAVINPSEFDNAKKQYFPQPGDKPKVIEQKRLNREAVIQGFDVVAGPGAKKTTPPSAEPKKINSMDEYNSLPSGATYIDPEGTTRRKK
jgi:hypothetical protein